MGKLILVSALLVAGVTAVAAHPSSDSSESEEVNLSFGFGTSWFGSGGDERGSRAMAMYIELGVLATRRIDAAITVGAITGGRYTPDPKLNQELGDLVLGARLWPLERPREMGMTATAVYARAGIGVGFVQRLPFNSIVNTDIDTSVGIAGALGFGWLPVRMHTVAVGFEFRDDIAFYSADVGLRHVMSFMGVLQILRL
jgi:hypothetical protein